MRTKSVCNKMRKIILLSYLIAGFLGCKSQAAEKATSRKLPLVSKMIKKKKLTTKSKGIGEAEPAYPRQLNAREASTETMELLPAGAYFYFDLPSGQVFTEEFSRTAFSNLLTEKSIARFFKDNSLGLDELFKDLPAEYSSLQSIALANIGTNLILNFIDVQGRVALAAYPGDEGSLKLCFLADIGNIRKPAFQKLENLLEKIQVDYPELILQRAKHGDDYIESLRSATKGEKAELAFGFVRNFMLVSNSVDFANKLLVSLKDNDKRLIDDQACQNLGSKTVSQSQLRGYLDLKRIIKSCSKSKIGSTGETISFAGDLTSRNILYYDLRADNRAVVENLTVPLTSDANTATLMNRLNLICRRDISLNSNNLYSPKLIPGEAKFFTVLKVNASDLANLLTEDSIFGSSNYALDLAGKRTATFINWLQVNSEKVEGLFDGEVGFAYLGKGPKNRQDWIVTLPLKNATGTEAIVQELGAKSVSFNNVKIYTNTGSLEGNNMVWTVFSQTQTTFRKLGKSFLVVASSGPVMQSIVERTIGSRATLVLNDDFQSQLKRLSGQSSMLLYYNFASFINAGYPGNLRAVIRTCYPRIQLHNIPHLNTLKKYLFGIGGSMSFTEGGVRLSFTSPTGIVTVASIDALLSLPVLLRTREENAILHARQKLASLNAALQEYATLYGRFPNSLHSTRDRESLSRILPDAEKLADLLRNDGALIRAKFKKNIGNNSYTYVPGLLPSDIGERVLLYTSGPYHYRYRSNKKQVYEAARLVLTLNGNITLYSEKDFKKRVLPQIGLPQN